MSSTLRGLLVAATLSLGVAAATPASAQAPSPVVQDKGGGYTINDTRPAGCSWRFKDPNVRERTINRYTYLHEMSNPPTCSPHGPILGTLSPNSTFRVYYADPYEPLWCYGYSVQIARLGYILCDAYN